MIPFIKKLFEKIGIGIVRFHDLQELKQNQIELLNLKSELDLRKYLFSTSLPFALIEKTLAEFSKSKSQLHQDLFALLISNFKFGGYFVEFGATDGIKFSNTFLLEKYFGWTGVLAEPARKWHSSLRINRNAAIETKCVWGLSGDKILFNETMVGELSTIDSLSSNDMHSHLRLKGEKYEVETITLEDLLAVNQSPHFIDFLSIDTEGSEFEILNVFNFDRHTFGFICCEHNFTPNRELVFNLLTSKGYSRIFSSYSRFDDWYVHNSLINTSGALRKIQTG